MSWIELLSFAAPSIIAGIAVIIASQQWLVSRNTLKLHLFEKRWVVYKELGDFINHVATASEIDRDRRVEFVQRTKGALFLFDEEIQNLIDEVNDKAVDIQSIRRSKPQLKDEERAQAIKDESEATKRLLDIKKRQNQIFEKWMKLKA